MYVICYFLYSEPFFSSFYFLLRAQSNDNMCLVAMPFKDCEKLLRALPAYIVPSALLHCRFILYSHTETLYVAKTASKGSAFEFEPSMG